MTEFFTQLQARKDQLPGIDSEEAIPASPQPPKWIEEANAYSKSLGELAAKYEEDAKNDNRDEIKKNLSSLQARKWLSEHRAAIEEEINRLKLLSQIQDAKKTVNTKALSRRRANWRKH